MSLGNELNITVNLPNDLITGITSQADSEKGDQSVWTWGRMVKVSYDVIKEIPSTLQKNWDNITSAAQYALDTAKSTWETIKFTAKYVHDTGVSTKKSVVENYEFWNEYGPNMVEPVKKRIGQGCVAGFAAGWFLGNPFAGAATGGIAGAGWELGKQYESAVTKWDISKKV